MSKKTKYEAFFDQINRTVIEVSASNPQEAAEKAMRKWRRTYAWPDVPHIQDAPKPTKR